MTIEDFPKPATRQGNQMRITVATASNAVERRVGRPAPSLPTQSTDNRAVASHRNQSTQLSSASTHDGEDTVLLLPLSLSKATSASTTRVLYIDTPTQHVSEFIKSVCRRTFSIADVWGTRRNSDAFWLAWTGTSSWGAMRL